MSQAGKYGLGLVFATQARAATCLSHHPQNPLTEEEVIARARGDR